jgi:hypothetical protein
MNTGPRAGWAKDDEGVGLEASGGPAVRQQFVELLDGVRSDAGEDVLKPRERVDLRQLAGRHEASQHGHGLAAAVASYERPVVPADRDSAQRPLGVVVVDR